MTCDRVRTWLFQESLPLWSDVGLDREAGGFFELLDFQGRPVLGVAKRMRVQARQIYTYAHAAVLGWQEGRALDSAWRGFDFLTRYYWHEDGGFIFTVAEDGTPDDQRRESYEQAFALLAFAWLFRASGEPLLLEWVERTLDFLDGTLGDSHFGGYRESVPDHLPRRQNPHMHLLEALLALHNATGDHAYRRRADAIIELFERKFFDPGTETLGEFFAEDWAPAAGTKGQIVEPGHHFEWVWLLHRYAELSGQDTTRDLAAALYHHAERYGRDREDGLAFDEVLRDGSLHKDSKRLWVQTEALKAQLAEAECRKRPGALDQAKILVDAIFEHYLTPGSGLWQDHVTRDRVGFAKAVPASTYYHLFLAFVEYLRVMEGSVSSPKALLAEDVSLG